jgi:hypothetical protein
LKRESRFDSQSVWRGTIRDSDRTNANVNSTLRPARTVQARSYVIAIGGAPPVRNVQRFSVKPARGLGGAPAPSEAECSGRRAAALRQEPCRDRLTLLARTGAMEDTNSSAEIRHPRLQGSAVHRFRGLRSRAGRPGVGDSLVGECCGIRHEPASFLIACAKI